MKMFSECRGECCVCSNGGFCLAGHGDDDFFPATKEKIIENLDEGKYTNYTEYMIKYLANEYGYVYDVKNVGRKKKKKQLTNEQPVEESFRGYTFKVVVAGKCVSCGKRIDDNNIFLCKDCQSKQNAESEEKKSEMTYSDAVHNAFMGKCIPYRKATKKKLKELLQVLEQEPCEDCISRQAVISVIYDRKSDFKNDFTQGFFADKIRDLLSVTQQPKMGQKIGQGHWIDDKCSVCGKGIEDLIASPEWYRNEVPRFCPFCGVKIEEEQE